MITRRTLLKVLGLSALGTTAAHSAIDTNTDSPSEFELNNWQDKVRYPVTESDNPSVQELLKARKSQQPIAFYYYGGSDPRLLRLATVESIFRVEGSQHRYISAYCHLRREHRTFRVDRISLA